MRLKEIYKLIVKTAVIKIGTNFQDIFISVQEKLLFSMIIYVT